MRVTILGCGSSGGVPRIGGDWGACDPSNPKNRRRRCSILVEDAGTTVLIDTAPDMREQLLDAGVGDLDGVVWTHDHADQTHGLDDLRVIAIRHRRRVNVWGDAETLRRLKAKFGYCFPEGTTGAYPAILNDHLIEGPFAVGNMHLVPFEQDHGTMKSLGFRIGDLAYANDVVRLDDAAFEAMAGARVMIVDALRYTPHPTHANVEQALEWIARVGPERAVLTNLHVDLDYETLKAELPDGIEPAYDGMIVDV
ncbi:MAG: MBL fold metallo-hydrolase [Minwuia sp.]|uniref:MBL fold metallo-hydrolase n=1 Tax=Minwuia sp. TaxID=2493630 RepID=UPI003A89A734